MVPPPAQVRPEIPANASDVMLNFLSRLVHLAFGSNRLRPYEEICIDAWRSTLPESLRKKLEGQLSKFDLIQRQARGTKSVFYDLRDPQYQTWGDDILFADRQEGRKVFAATLTGKIGDVAESVRFSIYLHHGRLSSIEFASEPGALASLLKGLAVEPVKCNTRGGVSPDSPAR